MQLPKRLLTITCILYIDYNMICKYSAEFEAGILYILKELVIIASPICIINYRTILRNVNYI